MPVRIAKRLLDKSHGFWSDVFANIGERKKGKSIVGIALKYLIRLENKFSELIGKEMINSIKGKNKHKITISVVGNYKRLAYKSSSAGAYKYGIYKHKTYGGESFKPLSPTTLKIRKKFKKIKRGKEFILRETDKHIFNGMKTRFVNFKNYLRLWVYWGGSNALVARKQNEGFIMRKGRVYGGIKARKDTKVPARPFIGIQDDCIKVITNAVKSLARAYGFK